MLKTFILAGFIVSTTRFAAAQESVRFNREDSKVVLATSYAPRTGTCRGIAIISPGAGGSEEGYQYVGDAMASFGYRAVVVGHSESGRRSLMEKLRGNGLHGALVALTTDPGAYRGRLFDIAAAKAWARARCDGTESLLIGHSMGAATVMMEAGARNTLGIRGADSFDAYIALSPQGIGPIFPENAWKGVKKPVLILTGTRDNELGRKSWKTRTEPFYDMPPGCKWLGVVDGATHLNFAGRGFSRQVTALCVKTIEAFLSGRRRGNCRPPPPVAGIALSTKE